MPSPVIPFFLHPPAQWVSAMERSSGSDCREDDSSDTSDLTSHQKDCGEFIKIIICKALRADSDPSPYFLPDRKYRDAHMLNEFPDMGGRADGDVADVIIENEMVEDSEEEVDTGEVRQ